MSQTVKAEGTGIEPDSNPCLSLDCLETCSNCNSSCAEPALHSGGSNCHSVAVGDADLSKQRTTNAVVSVSRERCYTNKLLMNGFRRNRPSASELNEQLSCIELPNSTDSANTAESETVYARIRTCTPKRINSSVRVSIRPRLDSLNGSGLSTCVKPSQKIVCTTVCTNSKNCVGDESQSSSSIYRIIACWPSLVDSDQELSHFCGLAGVADG